jgi:hypothetical protein
MSKSGNFSRCLTWFMALLFVALAAGCGGGGGRDPILGSGATLLLAVTANAPAAGATGVALNTKVSATFNKDVDAATINATTFKLTGPGAVAVPGAVSYAADTKTATFTPTTPTGVLLAGTSYTATVTTGAKDLAGNALASNFVWTFTTSGDTTGDTTPPTVTLVNPGDATAGACLQKIVNATFSEAMDPTTINSSPAGTLLTFTLKQTIAGTNVPGVVAYDVPTRVATFKSTSDLLASTSYTATITTAAKDLAGNALAANKVWTFTTGTTACATPPASTINLGTAATFGNLGGTAGTTNQGILTMIGGDIGSTATTTSAVTGFHDIAGDIYTETGSNKGAVNGKIYTCTVSTTGPTSAAVNPASCTTATNARNDAQTTYNQLALASAGSEIDPGANLGGLTLAPGVYKTAGGSMQITGSDLTLDAQGDATAVWIFKTASTLTVGGPAAPRNIILAGGALAKNVFWQVGTSATINAAGGGAMVGTIIASSAVSFSTAGNVAIVTLNGRAVGLNASVTMTNTVINVPAP